MIYLYNFLLALSITLGVLIPLIGFILLVSLIVKQRTKQMVKAATQATEQYLKAKLGESMTGVRH